MDPMKHHIKGKGAKEDIQNRLESLEATEFFFTHKENLTSSLMQMPIGIITMRVPDGKTLLMNPEAERILGFTYKELADGSLFDKYGFDEGKWACLYPDRTPYALEELPSYRSLKTCSISQNVEMILKRRDGEELWIMTNLAPIYEKTNTPISIFIIFTDITPSKSEQERICLNEERLNYALTAADEGIWDWNLETGDGYCSPRYYSMLGYENEEFPGNSDAWKQLIHPDDKKRVLAGISEVLADKNKDYEVVYRMRCKNGDYRWILSHGLALMHNSSGVPTRLIGTHKDITKRKHMELELQRHQNELEIEIEKRTRDLLEANRQLEAIFNISSESIWICDGAGIVLKVNKATERLYGIKPDKIVGASVRELMDQGYMDRSATLEVLATKRQISMIQYIPIRKRQLLVTGTPIFNAEGEISLVTVVERDLTELNRLHQKLERNQQLSSRYQQELKEWNTLKVQKQRVVAQSPKMRDVLRTAIKLASQNVSNILILGESGTGKGLLSKLIHENSPHSKGPFIEINCAALPETLLEAELFGYEKGAFTGAREQGKAGLFELAQNGTLFLDEIGDLPLTLQAKILKYLDDNTIMHLGGMKPIPIDCTIIAATNLDLESQVRQKKFRNDLYYRLNTFTISIPPLRERRDDIFELIRYFNERYNKEFNTQKQFSPSAVNALEAYRFPGNVRELKSLVKKAVVLSEGDTLDEVLFETIGRDQIENPVEYAELDQESASLASRLDKYEHLILKDALKRFRTTRQLASYLNSSQSSIARKLKKHGLTPDSNHK